MAFPSTLSIFPRPTTTDTLNSPSHSGLHNTVSSALGQVEAVIGVDGANSVVGTMMYDLRSPASKGGGHVQGAAFGGTGQTTFTKGDILVAQSASVLTKLAIGTDDQVLTASSVQSTGVKWANHAYKNGVITRNLNDANGTQAIAHGLGAVPKRVLISGHAAIGGGVWSDSFGGYDSGGQSCFYRFTAGAGPTSSVFSSSVFAIKFITETANDATGTISVDATNINIAWVKQNAPAATAHMEWQANT